MNRKLKAARIKKVVEQQTKIRTAKNPHLLHIAEFEAGEFLENKKGEDSEPGNSGLYEGVTDNATEDGNANYQMITRSENVADSQGS